MTHERMERRMDEREERDAKTRRDEWNAREMEALHPRHINARLAEALAKSEARAMREAQR